MRAKHIDLAILAVSVLGAFVLWYIVFAVPIGNFWIKIALAALALALLSLPEGRRIRQELSPFTLRHLITGTGSALLLYGIFWLGKYLLLRIFAGSQGHISSLYNLRSTLSPWIIAPLLLLVTGPCEEIFWRGRLQASLVRLWSPAAGLLLAAALYSLVHIWTLNPPLILAAFVAGLFWGLLYLREKSLFPVVVSHSLWSLLIFILFPLA